MRTHLKLIAFLLCLGICSSSTFAEQSTDVKFNAAVWRDAGLPDRKAQFASLLSEYDLIGMPRTQLNELLGPSEFKKENASFYYLVSGFCGYTSTGIEIEFEAGTVSRWRENIDLGGERTSAPWVTKNVLIKTKLPEDIGGRLEFLHLVPK